MFQFGWILGWLSKNFLRLIVLLFFLVFLFFLVSLLIPILSFFSFFFDIFSEIQNFFNEMQKNIDEFKWEKNEPLEKENEKRA